VPPPLDPDPVSPGDPSAEPAVPPPLPPNPLGSPAFTGNRVPHFAIPVRSRVTSNAWLRRRDSEASTRRVTSLLLALLCTLVAWAIYRVGLNGFYVTEGKVSLARLLPYATGPLEVYVVPDLPIEVSATMSLQSEKLIKSFANDPLRASFGPMVRPDPATGAPLAAVFPEELGVVLCAQMPPAVYGVVASPWYDLNIFSLPVAPEFRRPEKPYTLYFIGPQMYTHYRNEVASIKLPNYASTLENLRTSVAADLAQLGAQSQGSTPNQTMSVFDRLDAAWLLEFQDFLKKLPADPKPILDGSDPNFGALPARVPTQEPINFDALLAGLAIAHITLPPDGEMHVPGRGTAVVRVPLAGGYAVYVPLPSDKEDVHVENLTTNLNADYRFLAHRIVPGQLYFAAAYMRNALRSDLDLVRDWFSSKIEEPTEEAPPAAPAAAPAANSTAGA
jgi:hypothetical protein